MNRSPVEFAAAIRQRDRRALARAITLVESTRPDHRREASELLDLLATTGGTKRIAITGTPGVGKSTFIEVFGLHLANLGHRVAVLTIDPSSTRTGGSILGDKTRMTELARHPNAFIRPSPSGGRLGGVARRTRETISLVEGAGFDVVLVETVGVGQSETDVANMTDVFVLLVAPAGGDELQGVKRGIMELADVIVVNKCDGPLEAQAMATLSDYASSLRLLRPTTPTWSPVAIPASALTGRGVAELWQAIQHRHEALDATGELTDRRATQRQAWLWDEIRAELFERFRSDAETRRHVALIEKSVVAGSRSVASGVRELLGGRD